MAGLTLSLLGTFTAATQDTPLNHFRTHKVQALLIYLAVENDRAHLRESLMELLWPGMPLESAQVNLRQTIYRLRKAIPQVDNLSGSEPVALILSDRQAVQLNPEAEVDLDVAAFRSRLGADPAGAVKLYRGDFLADFYLVDSSPFETWAQSVRENLRRQVLDALDRLVQAVSESGDHHQAQVYAWRQLEIDSLRENAYRQLMLALAAGGQRSAALAQYQVCRRRLVRELGLEPSPETTAVYEQIQAETLKGTKKQPEIRKLRTGEMPVFMLTDIERSTRLWDTHRQAMLTALMTHNKVLEDTIVHYGGRILELRGDGVKAVFEGVNPLQCVLDIQRALGEADWGEIGDLRIRIGLHGVPTVHKDFDYFIEDDKYYGPVLNHTARIMDAGHGGQILVSEQVHNTFSLPQGASWQDYGPQDVKSLDHPLQIYGLVHPDNPLQSFPPLRTLTNHQQDILVDATDIKHNLVPQLTPFIGREKELARLDALLANPDTRLITITGPGGMGKTRLAIACAEKQLGAGDGTGCPFPDGVFFIPLADIDNPDQIPDTIAKGVNISLNPGGMGEGAGVEKQLLGYLRRKQLLLVVDNFEQLLDGASILTDILQAAPVLQMLVTSRERLHLQAEQVFPIAGLDFPDWEAPEDPCDFTAMQLFLESAKRVQPDFEIMPGDMVHLTRICNLVGGMPLGLELAASWVDMMPVKEIAAEIQRGIDFLESDARDLPARHRSLRVVCDSTWEWLSNREKDVFASLSVFQGGFTREAAKAVSGASIRALAALQSKSLIQYTPTNERYRIHPYLREYSLEKLSKNPELIKAAQDCHSAYFSDLVEASALEFYTGETGAAYEQMDDEIANIKAAWLWNIKNEQVLRIAQLLDGLYEYLLWNFKLTEIIATYQEVDKALEKIAAQGRSTGESAVDPNMIQRVQTKVQTRLGYYLYIYDDDAAQGALLMDQSMAKLNSLAEVGYEVRAEKAELLRFQGRLSEDYNVAKPLFLKSIALSEEVKNDWGMLEGFMGLGEVTMQKKGPMEALGWWEQALSLAQNIKDQWHEILCLQRLGTAHLSGPFGGTHFVSTGGLAFSKLNSLQLPDTLNQSLHYFDKAIAKARAYGNPRLEFGVHFEFGAAQVTSGNLEIGREYFEHSTQISERAGLLFKALVLYYLGDTHWLSGRFDEAEQSFLSAIDFNRDIPVPPVPLPLACYSQFLALTGRYQEALVGVYQKNKWAEDLFVSDIYLGIQSRVKCWVALVQGEYETAKSHSSYRIDRARALSWEGWVAESQADIARAEYGLGNYEEARRLLHEALKTTFRLPVYYHLVFVLPVTLLILDDEDRDLASEIYRKVMSDPFLGKAQLYHDLVYKHLPDEITSIPIETVETSPEHRKRLWAAALKVLTVWSNDGD